MGNFLCANLVDQPTSVGAHHTIFYLLNFRLSASTDYDCIRSPSTGTGDDNTTIGAQIIFIYCQRTLSAVFQIFSQSVRHHGTGVLLGESKMAPANLRHAMPAEYLLRYDSWQFKSQKTTNMCRLAGKCRCTAFCIKCFAFRNAFLSRIFTDAVVVVLKGDVAGYAGVRFFDQVRASKSWD